MYVCFHSQSANRHGPPCLFSFPRGGGGGGGGGKTYSGEQGDVVVFWNKNERGENTRAPVQRELELEQRDDVTALPNMRMEKTDTGSDLI